MRLAMTLPQNGAKAAREYCGACGAEASQNDGVTTVTKFRPMPIKYSALQRANLALQPRLQLDSLVVAHAIYSARAESFFHYGRGFMRANRRPGVAPPMFSSRRNCPRE